MGLYDEVSPYLHNVCHIGNMNEGPTWVICSLLKYYVKCNLKYVSCFMKIFYGCMWSRLVVRMVSLCP